MRKKILLLLVVLSMTISNSYSQWVQQTSPVNHHLTNVRFVNERTGWITTYSGSILKTTNSGANWIVQYSIPGKRMFGLSVVDSNTVYVVGWFQTILKTTDSGENWVEISNGPWGTGHSYDAVYFINKDTGWVSGTGQLVFKTTNGGKTFDSATVSGFSYDIYFKNANEGLVCGQTAAMHRTTDGGRSWNPIYVPVGTQSADFGKLTFVDENTGYTQGVSNGKVYKTTNFGLTWDSLTRIPEASFLSCIFFSSPSTGWSCGDQNQLYKTTDAGVTWRRENTSNLTPYGIRAIHFISDSIGWCVGDVGKIAHTTNGGLTFIKSALSTTPVNFYLEQNYPNPFNLQTRIRYKIGKLGKYKMEIYNIIGQIQETLFDGVRTAGDYTITYNAERLTSGIYYYVLSSDKEILTKKFVLTK
ncbi:MAG: T9SS type A sorting domain-containing protein [Ignavibacteria bacterium]|nr:T9SS type A sorting domain-containing protein [Ignavibacteria bacterium]